MASPIRPSLGHGNLRISGELYVSDIQNNLLRDITDAMARAQVRVIWDDDVKWSLDVELEGHGVAMAVTDWLSPFLIVAWRDAAGQEREVKRQLGHYEFLPSPRSYERTRQVTEIQAFDAMDSIAQLTANRMITATPGQLCGEVAALFLRGQSDIRLDIPPTDMRTGKPRVASPSADLLPIANEVLNAGGYTGLTPDHTGLVSAQPWPNLTHTPVSRELRSALGDVFGTPTLEPDREAFFNQVILRSTDPDADIAMKHGYRITNTDPDSRYSAQRLGRVRTARISDSTDLSLDTIRRRARYMLERSTSMEARLRLDVVPDPRIAPHEVWDIDVRQDDGFVMGRGRWYVNELVFGFTPEDGTQQVVLSKLAHITDVD